MVNCFIKSCPFYHMKPSDKLPKVSCVPTLEDGLQNWLQLPGIVWQVLYLGIKCGRFLSLQCGTIGLQLLLHLLRQNHRVILVLCIFTHSRKLMKPPMSVDHIIICISFLFFSFHHSPSSQKAQDLVWYFCVSVIGFQQILPRYIRGVMSNTRNSGQFTT